MHSYFKRQIITLVSKLNLNWCLFDLLNKTSRVSRAIYLFLILREGETKQKNTLGTRLKLGAMFPSKLGFLKWLEKVVNYISDLTLLPRRIEILRDKMIGIRYSNFHFITGLVHSFHFYKVCLAMFGPRTLDCIVEPKQTSEDALKSGKNELVVSIINLVPLRQERIRLLAYVEYFMLI